MLTLVGSLYLQEPGPTDTLMTSKQSVRQTHRCKRLLLQIEPDTEGKEKFFVRGGKGKGKR